MIDDIENPILRRRLCMTAHREPGGRADRRDEPTEARKSAIEARAPEPRIVKRDPDTYAPRRRRRDTRRGAPESESADRGGSNRHNDEPRNNAVTDARASGGDLLPQRRAARTGDHRDADIRRRRPDQSATSVRARFAHHFRRARYVSVAPASGSAGFL
jgi:hypothetical protein